MKHVVFAATLVAAQAVGSSRFDAAQGRPFEVASVKVNQTRGGTTRRIEPQTLTYLNIPLWEFMQMAYDVRRYQIVAPDWVLDIATRDRYTFSVNLFGVPAGLAPADRKTLNFEATRRRSPHCRSSSG